MTDRAVAALLRASELGHDHPMVDVALALAEALWPVFPCGLDKSPLVSGGFKSRSFNTDQVRAWWSLHPDALPAIVPGDQGLAAFDVDSEKSYIAALDAGLWKMEHLSVRTGGTSKPFDCGGIEMFPCHVYVRADEQPVVKGVVVRYRGGYVIAPGARREGRLYYAVAPIPEGELGKWTSAGRGGNDAAGKMGYATPAADVPLARVEQAVMSVPNAAETDREQYVGMAHMIKGSVGELGRGLFLRWAEQWPGGSNPAEDARVWDTLPESRLGWTELWGVASQHGFDAGPEIAAQAQADFPVSENGKEPAGAAESAETTRDKLDKMLVAIRDAKDGIDRALALSRLRRAGFSPGEVRLMLNELAPVESDEVMTLTDLWKSPELMTPPKAILPYLAWPGLKTLLAAREKGGKSTLAMAAIAALSRGEPFLGEPTSAQSVVWLTEEPLAIVAERARAMRVNGDIVSVGAMSQNPQAQLKRALRKGAPGVVVIDTLYRFSGIEADGENDAGTWLPILMLLDEVTRAGSALLILAHSTKSGQNGEYRGSSAIGGFVDAILEMRKPKDGENTRKLFGRGRLHFGKPFVVRKLPDDSFELLSDEGLKQVVEQKRASSLEEKIVAHLRKHPGDSANDIKESIGGKRETVLAAVKALKEAGQVTEDNEVVDL